MEETGPIPRFEIIGRFNLTNVPHAVSRWTTYVTMVKCTILETKKSRCRIENLVLHVQGRFFFIIYLFIFLIL